MFGLFRKDNPPGPNVQRLLEFHCTANFGSRANLVRQSQDAHRLYHVLEPAEVTALLDTVLSETEARKRSLSTVLCSLACLQPGSLTNHHDRLAQEQVLYPGVAFAGATPTISQQLLKMVPRVQDNTLNLNHLLVALAWIGDENVQRAFAQWRAQPPEWVSSLHVAPHEYAAEAGWELTPEGTRRDLFFRAAVSLVKNEGTIPSTGPLHVGAPLAEKCRWCANSMTALLDVETTSPLLAFLAAAGPRFTIGSCYLCTCYGPIFAHTDLHGGVRWHEASAKPSYLHAPSDSEDAFPQDVLRLGSEPRHYIESASWMLPGNSCSQIGGLPTWIQDAEFPKCPSCSRKMLFVGQISMEDCVKFGEGIYYAFLCPECRVTATRYQQS